RLPVDAGADQHQPRNPEPAADPGARRRPGVADRGREYQALAALGAHARAGAAGGRDGPDHADGARVLERPRPQVPGLHRVGAPERRALSGVPDADDWLLAIESASQRASVALLRGGEVAALRDVPPERPASETLLPTILELLAEHELAPAALRRFA